MNARVVIAGGGIAGLGLALALARAFGDGSEIMLADPALVHVGRSDGRAYAISPAARRMLSTLGVWDGLGGQAEPIREMIITDSRPQDVVRPVYLTFGEAEGGAEPLAHMTWSAALVKVLSAACKALGVQLEAQPVTSVDRLPTRIDARLADGRQVRAEVIVAADGKGSRLREQAGIGWIGFDYRQSGIVATIGHERPHEGRAYEHFLPAGPFAILPMPDNVDGRHRSSIVWTESTRDADTMVSLPPDDLIEELERRFGYTLGDIAFLSRPRAFPLSFGLARRFVDARMALLGDAAHVVHPIAGQGINLGLKGAAALAETLVDAARLGLDLGSREALEPYEHAHRVDTVAMGLATDGLNRLFSNDLTPLRLVRDLGLGVVDRMSPLKRFFIGQASGLGATPKLLRGEAI